MHPLGLLTSTNIVLLFHIVPSANWFRRAIKTINRLYKFVSIKDIESYYYTDRRFNNSCHICFDDGDKTFYENAFPVLKEMKIQATLFLSPKVISEEANYWFQEIECLRTCRCDAAIKKVVCEMRNADYEKIKRYSVSSIFKSMRLANILHIIDVLKKEHNIDIGTRYNLTKSQFYEVADSSLVTIGAHTMNHPILSNETDDIAENEIEESVRLLTEITGKGIRYFAYPNGTSRLDYGAREQSILRKIKIKLAFTTDKNFFSKKSDPFAIPRGMFSREKNMLILSELLVLPAWGCFRDIVRPGKNQVKIEAKERAEIKNQKRFVL